MALGMVTQLPETDDETSVTRRQLLAKLDVCMGGRVAEEIIFGGLGVAGVGEIMSLAGGGLGGCL
jgi:ATP-dependent Zn protease